MIGESKPMSLSDYLGSSELAAAKAGKLKLWQAAYARARLTLGVSAACAKANIAVGVMVSFDTFEAADPETVLVIRIELTDQKIKRLCGEAL